MSKKFTCCCGDCRGGLRPPARVGYGFLSDGPAGERSSPLQAYNDVLVLARVVGAVFDRQPGLATVFCRMDRRASAARPYRHAPGLWVPDGGRPQLALAVFRNTIEPSEPSPCVPLGIPSLTPNYHHGS
jgi:hypothetical protein